MAGKYTIQLDQGATFIMNVVCKDSSGVPINLGGYSARMMIRDSYDSASPRISLTSSPAAGITITDASGSLDIRIEAAATAAIPAGTSYVYDLEIQSAQGTVYRIMQGRVVVSPEATKG